MKNTTLLIAFFLITCFVSTAFQFPSKFKYLFTNPSISKVSLVEASQKDLRDFFESDYQKTLDLGKDSDLKLVKIEQDANGNTHVKTQQVYQDIPIFGAWLNFHTRDGRLSQTNGKIARQISTNTTPNLTETEALDFALKIVPATTYAWQDDDFNHAMQQKLNQPNATFEPEGKLILVPEQLFSKRSSSGLNLDNHNYQLCWTFDIYALAPVRKYEQVFINAQSGSVVYRIPKMMNCGVPAQGQAAYQPNLVSIVTDSCNNAGNLTYQLHDSNRKIKVFNALNTTGTPPFSFFNNSTLWVFPEADTVAIAAQWGLAQWYDYTLNKLNWQGFDNSPTSAILAWVHHGNDFGNAFYDGFLNFGDGNPNGTLKTPLVSLDICSHEAQHGVVEHTCNLVSIGEPGILNEFIADFFACMVEWAASANNTSIVPDYLIGEDLVAGGVRRIDAPNILGLPDTYQSTNNGWVQQITPISGLHANSTVAGHCFYLLAEGGTGFSDFGTAYSVDPIGRDATAELLFHTMRFYLNPVDGFFELRQATIAAASNLGWSQSEIDNIASAFCAIEVGGCTAQGEETLTLLTPNGGESYAPAETIAIEWENSVGVTGVKVFFSINGGATWQEIEDFLPVTSTLGNYDFIVPNVSSDLCKIRVAAINEPLAFDASDEVFSINSCDVLGNFTLLPTSGCFGTNFSITNTSESTDVAWFLDGLPYPAASAGFSLENPLPGTHEIIQISTNGTCVDTFSRSIFVADIPTADFNIATSNLLVTAVADFSGSEQIFWSIDGELQEAFNNSQSMNWTAPNTGTYTVCLFVDDNCSISGEEQCQTITIEEATLCEGEEEEWDYYSNPYEMNDVLVRGDTLIISSSSGLIILDRATNEKTVLTPTNSTLPCFELGTMAANSHGDIYIVLENDGFLKINGNTFELEQHYVQSNVTGLNSNQINAIEVDAQDRVWLGTENGLWIGDPDTNNFTLLTTGEGLPDNRITCLSIANNELTWVGTREGAAKVEGLMVTASYTADVLLLNTDYVRAIYGEADDVLIGTGAGISRLNSNGWTHYDGEDFGLFSSNATVLTIAKGNNGKFYIGISVNTYVYEFDGNTEFIQYNQPLQLKSGVVRNLITENNNILVIGEERILNWDTNDAWEVYQTMLYPFLDNSVEEILMTSNGATLVTMGKEIFRVENDTFIPINYESYLPSISTPTFQSNMVELEDGSIISGIGLSNHSIARYFPNNNDAWTFFEKDPDGLFFDPEVLAYHDGVLACGAFEGIYLMNIQTGEGEFFDANNSPIYRFSDDLEFDANGTLYVNTGGYAPGVSSNGRIYTYDGIEWDTVALPATYTHLPNFAFHPDGSIIFQTGNGPPSFSKFVRCFNPIDSSFTTFSEITTFVNTTHHTSIIEIAIDTQGFIYIGTSSEGVVVCNKNGEILNHYNTCNSGLPGDYITTIDFKNDGSIWFGTNNGIGVLYPASQIIEPTFSQPISVCQNTSTFFGNTTLGAIEWEWRIDGALTSTEKDFEHTFSTVGTYILELTAYNQEGCGTSSSQSVTIHPKADLSQMPTEVVSCDNTYSLCAPEGMATYSWKNGNTIVSETECLSVNQTNDGIYTLTVTDQCGNSASTVIIISLTGACVYPGDLNNDRVCDFRDALWFGYTYGFGETARNEQGIEWRGYPSLDWIQNLPNGVNYAHCDANGNGYIDLGDFEAIQKNYLKTHGDFPDLPNQTSSPYSFVPILSNVDTTLGNNQYELTIDIIAQNANGGGINNFYGAGMRIYYILPPGIELVGEPSFSFDNSSLNMADENVVELVEVYSDEQFLDIAITKLDHVNQSGVTILGSGQFILITDNLAAGDSLEFELAITGPTGISSDGNFIPINGGQSNFNFGSGTTTATDEISLASVFTVFPNPSNGKFFITELQATTAEKTYQLFDTKGVAIHPPIEKTGHDAATIDLSNFSNGIYSLIITTPTEQVIKKLVKF